MSNILTSRNLSLLAGLLCAVLTIHDYATTQSSLLITGLVFVGCLLFWAWIASIIMSFFLWLRSEIILMGRPPRVNWPPSSFGLAKLVAQVIGLALPFVWNWSNEGSAALMNPEHWALVPVTLGACLAIVTIPLWIALKIGASRLNGTATQEQ